MEHLFTLTVFFLILLTTMSIFKVYEIFNRAYKSQNISQITYIDCVKPIQGFTVGESYRAIVNQDDFVLYDDNKIMRKFHKSELVFNL